MEQKDFTVSITVNDTPEAVFNSINNVPAWWSTEFEGSSEKLNDEFVISHTGTHHSRQKVVEFIPNKKIVWLVTDSKLDWLQTDKYEWSGTKMIFELTPNGDNTVLKFTHAGIGPGKECYERCSQSWDMVIKERLYKIITNGKS